MVLEKPARPPPRIKVINAMPDPTDFRFAIVMDPATSLLVEKDAFAGTRLEGQKISEDATDGLRVTGPFLVSKENAHEQVPVVTTARTGIGTVITVLTVHHLPYEPRKADTFGRGYGPQLCQLSQRSSPCGRRGIWRRQMTENRAYESRSVGSAAASEISRGRAPPYE
jgi:hypothetical protein